MNRISKEQALRLANVATVLLVLSSVAFIFSRTYSECLWGHLKAGMDFLDAGNVIRHDPYSYLTSDMQWIDHEWLFEVAIASVYRMAGIFGLSIMKELLVVAWFGMMVAWLLRQQVSPMLAAMLLILATPVVGVSLFALRPHLFSIIGFSAVLMILQEAEAGKRKLLWLLPLIFMIWCNLHGAYVSGLGMVAIWLAVDAITSRRFVLNIGVGMACLLVTIINPYGIELPIFLARTLSIARPEIADWQPISVATLLGKCYIGWLIAAIVVLHKSKLPKSFASMAILIVAVIQPFSAIRHVSFGLTALLIICARHIASVTARDTKAIHAPSKMLMAGLGSVAAIVMLVLSIPNIGSINIVGDMPRNAVQLIRDSNVKGNLATVMDWGDYVIWFDYPNIKVSNDWRRETAYSAHRQGVNLAFASGSPGWDTVLEKEPTDLVLVPKQIPTYSLMMLKPGWQLIYDDPASALFAKRNTDIAMQLQRTKTPNVATVLFP